MDSPTSFGGERHNLSYQQLVFYAVNDARIAFVNGRDLDRHILGLWSFAYPLSRKPGNAVWLDTWNALRDRYPEGGKVPFLVRHRQFTMLLDMFWKYNILSLRGTPFANVGNVMELSGLDSSMEEQEEWEP